MLLDNRKLMKEQNVFITDLESDHLALETQGKTIMILAFEGVVAGLIAHGYSKGKCCPKQLNS